MGLALLGKKVVAFDTDPHERRICRGMSQVNEVFNGLLIRGWCTGKDLRSLTSRERALIISDIEGGELELFTPDVIRDLRHCDIIIELHANTPEENQPFVHRFVGTHRVEIIDHPREPSGVELIAFLGPEAPRMATESRPFQQWLIARAEDCATASTALDR